MNQAANEKNEIQRGYIALIDYDILSTQVKRIVWNCKEILDFEHALESGTQLDTTPNSDQKQPSKIPFQFLNDFRFSPDGHLFSSQELYRREKGEVLFLVLEVFFSFEQEPGAGWQNFKRRSNKFEAEPKTLSSSAHGIRAFAIGLATLKKT